jgi:hypothetical protein
VSALTEVPSDYVHPVGKIVEIEDGEAYSNEVESRGTTDLMDDGAEVVTSTIVETHPVDPFDLFGSPEPRHTIMLDLDVPATLIPSTTPGHSHLYIDVPLEWSKYKILLDALAEAGVIELGYASASKARGFSSLRLPWVKKRKPVAVRL